MSCGAGNLGYSGPQIKHFSISALAFSYTPDNMGGLSAWYNARDPDLMIPWIASRWFQPCGTYQMRFAVSVLFSEVEDLVRQ
jgi:hypothetical protein